MASSSNPPLTAGTAAHFAQQLLSRAHSPTTAREIFTDRAVQKPLVTQKSTPDPSARALRRKARNQRKEKEKRRAKLKPRPLSAAQKRKLCLFEIPSEQRKWELFEGLHKMWIGYMQEILGITDGGKDSYLAPGFAGPMVATADMHGAMIEVVRSRCVGRVGVEGIVVRDSKNAFEIITRQNKIKTLPKEHTIFRMKIPPASTEEDEDKTPFIFEVIGEEFQTRAPDRAKRIPKMHWRPDI